MNYVWIVSVYDKYIDDITVTSFNNEEAANEYYTYEKNQFYPYHRKVSIDKCPVYSTFKETNDESL